MGKDGAQATRSEVGAAPAAAGHGRLQSSPGGVDVFSASGQALGSIAVGPTSNLAFAGGQLVMLQGTRVIKLATRARGVALPMQ